MLVIVHNIAVRKSLFTTNSLTFDPLRLLEVDPYPHEWRNLEDKWSVTSRLIEPIYPSILSPNGFTDSVSRPESQIP